MLRFSGRHVRQVLVLALSLIAGWSVFSQVVKADTCLACHGPYEKLSADTANYSGWISGEKLSPHRYFPHDTKDIPECVFCHKPHPIPPSASDIKAMLNVKPTYCYECHHMGQMTCGDCHPIP